jgi:hypothetical protein
VAKQIENYQLHSRIIVATTETPQLNAP